MNEVTYGIIQGLPPEIEPGVRVKNYAYFELRWPSRTYTDKEFGGPLIVAVKENPETGVVIVNWYKRNAAMLRFNADDNQIATAWMVDDISWFNRLFLLDQPDKFRVMNYHTRSGTYAGDYVNLEIECMREVMKHSVEMVEVLKNGVPCDWFMTKTDADRFIEKQAKVVTKLSKEGVITETKHDFNFSTRPGLHFTYKPEFAVLAKQYKNLPHGWTSCPEFMKKYKPMILELIASKRKTEQKVETTVSKEAIMNTLRGLTLEERQELLSVVPDVPKATIPDAPEVVDTPEAPQPEAQDAEFKINTDGIEKFMVNIDEKPSDPQAPPSPPPTQPKPKRSTRKPRAVGVPK